jgi:hypothetical protein
MASSRRWLAPLTALAVGLIGVLVWAMLPRAPAAVAPTLATSLARSGPEGERVGAGTLEGDRRELVERPVEQSETEATSEPNVVATWSLWGTVLRASDGTPVAGATVALGPELSATSDGHGRFELELASGARPRGSRRSVWVTHENGEPLLNEECTLEPGMVLRVDDEFVWLHGSVVDGLGSPVVVEGLTLSCELGEGRGRLLGRPGACDAEGRFRIAARGADLECESVTLHLWLARTRFPVSTTVAALRSEEGATAVLDVCPFTIEVRASDGGELVEPALRLVAWRRGAEHAQLQSFPELDSALGVSLLLERDVERIEVAAGAEGCAPWIEERDVPPCGSTLRIELQRLGPDDVIEGVVLDPAGNPVPLAFASCSPPSLDREMVAVPAIRGARTHVDGRFSLPFAAGSTARVMAYHRDHGSTGEQLVQGGRRDLVLRFLPVARLDVQLFTPDGEEPCVESTRFALALDDGTRSLEFGACGRVSIEEVPLGRHSLLCVSGDERWWGLFMVDVFDTGPQAVLRTLAPARWAEGRLVDGAGAPLADVQVHWPGAPLEPGGEWNPFSSASDPSGRFRVLLGSHNEAQLVFLRAGIELASERLAAGATTEVTIHLAN